MHRILIFKERGNNYWFYKNEIMTAISYNVVIMNMKILELNFRIASPSFTLIATFYET